MSDVIIRAEGLCKQYLIGHEGEKERYTALRDSLSRTVKGLARSAREMMRGNQIIAGDQVEEFWALKDVNFEIKRGQAVGIIGRNGAGKSTLLKILSRITEPSAGRVEIRGRVASLLEVGTGFHPELTGRENIFLNGAILSMSHAEIKRKFDEIVAFAEIEKFLDTPVKRYSSGMYVRLAFAVAAHLEPEILVIDEVLAVGDAEFQKKCLGKMQDVAGHGRTVLFVSHNMGAVRQLCDSGLLLDRGGISFKGPIGEATEAYSSRADTAFTVSFLPQQEKPAITRVAINPAELPRRNLFIEIEFESPSVLSPPVGGVVLYASSGEPVWGSNARFHSYEQKPSLCTGLLHCRCEGLPIREGQYSLSVWLGNWRQDFDHKSDVLRFWVGEPSYNYLKPSATAQGHLDWDASWTTSANL